MTITEINNQLTEALRQGIKNELIKLINDDQMHTEKFDILLNELKKLSL